MVRILVAIALGLAATAGAAAQGMPEWQRDWVSKSFDCSQCSPEDRAWLNERLGSTVLFGSTRFVNPFYEDCPQGVDYSNVRPVPAAAAQRFFGTGRLPPLMSALPLAGTVGCAEPSGPPNTIASVVIDGSKAYLLHESGAVLTLH